MIEVIKNLLEIFSKSWFNFTETVNGVLSFVVELMGDLKWVIDNLNANKDSIGDWLSWMPLEISATLTSCVAIAIIFKVLGRE